MSLPFVMEGVIEMYKDFIGWAREPDKTETKYIIEYIADDKTWNKFCHAAENYRLMPNGQREWEDFCTKKEFDNIEDALTFYMAIFVDYGFKYCVKMWQQIYVDGEMILEEWVEPKGHVVNSMRQRINREMITDLRKFAVENEQLHKSNELMNSFIKAMGKQFQDMFKEYCEREAEKHE